MVCAQKIWSRNDYEDACQMLLSFEQKYGMCDELTEILSSPVVFKQIELWGSMGWPVGMIFLARAYQNGWGTEKNHERAVELAKTLVRCFDDKKYSNEAKKAYDEIINTNNNVNTNANKESVPVTEVSLRCYPDKNTIIGRITLDNGDIYEGEYYIDNTGLMCPHGYGKAYFANGEIWDGEWDDGMRASLGLHTFPDGTKKAQSTRWGATFDQDMEKENIKKILSRIAARTEKRNVELSKTQTIPASGKTFKIADMMFKQGKTEQHASATNADKPKAVPVPDSPKRKRLTYTNGDTYEGEVLNGKRHGKGRYTFKSGAYYDGEWKSGEKQGHGKYVFADGTYYDGEWVNGVKQGKGKFTEKSGEYTSIYEGEYINGQREGRFVGEVLNSSSGKKYLRFYKDDKFVSEHDITEENKNWTLEDSNKSWHDSNEELRRRLDADNSAKTASAATGNSTYVDNLIDSWRKIMAEDYDGGVGGNAKNFYNRYMSGISENFCPAPEASWDGNGFSPELDEILSLLCDQNMTAFINKAFRDNIVYENGTRSWLEGPEEVVCKVADELQEVAENPLLYKSWLAGNLSRMLAYIAAFYLGTEIFTDFYTSEEALNTLAFSFGGYRARTAQALTHLYYARKYMNGKASVPSNLTDDEWANGELLDELLRGDTVYFDGWTLDMSDLKSYYTQNVGKVKYYGAKPPYDDDTPLSRSSGYADELLEDAQRIFNSGYFWDATKMLCDFLNIDVLVAKRNYELSHTDFIQLLRDLLSAFTAKTAEEQDYSYDCGNLINLCFAAYLKYEEEYFLYFARRAYFDANACTCRSEISESSVSEGDFVAWLYFRRLELTGDASEPIDDNSMENDQDIWIERCYGEVLDEKLKRGLVMCSCGYVRVK